MVFKPHAKITLSGTIPGEGANDEIFVTGWRIVPAGSTQGPVDTAAALTAITAPIVAFWQSPNSHLSTVSKLMQIKVSNIDPEGHVIGTPSDELLSGGLSGSGGQLLPAFCCIVATLEPATNPTRRRRGRMYLPALAAGIGQGSVIADADANNIATLTAGVLGACKDAGYQPVVASVMDAGMNTDVAAVTVDNIIDSQSRRKNAVNGTRSARHNVT